MSHIWLSRRHLSVTRFLNQDVSTCTWYTDYWKLMHTMEDITQQRTRGRSDLCFCVLLHSGKTQIMSLCGSFGSYCVSRGFQGLPASQWPTASRVASHSAFNFKFFYSIASLSLCIFVCNMWIALIWMCILFKWSNFSIVELLGGTQRRNQTHVSALS